MLSFIVGVRMDDLVFGMDNLSYLTGVATAWISYGIGFGAILWMVGQGMRLIFSFVRF